MCDRKSLGANANMTVPAWHEEPISKKHDRDRFDCGDRVLNDFLRRYARKSHEAGGAKTFLAIDDADNTTILGFYSLSPRQLILIGRRRSSGAAWPAMAYRVFGLQDLPLPLSAVAVALAAARG